MRIVTAAAVAASILSIGACAAVEDGQRSGRDERAQIETRSLEVAYYVVTRPDLRKCAYPMCGGVFVAEVNHEESTCLGGEASPDCHAVDIDLSALGLDAETESEVIAQATAGHALLRGQLTVHSEAFPQSSKLVVDGAWLGQTLGQPTGNWSHVVDSGIQCITFPCGATNEAVLNSDVTNMLAGVDFAASGASEAVVSQAQTLLFQGGGVIVSGSYEPVSGPGGDGTMLVASEIYFAVASKAGKPCGNAVCGEGYYCCNASCSMCAPEGNMCIQIACEPEEPAECAHDVCEAGDALASDCSPCASTVCAQDPYCCDTAWDELCVFEAEDWCGESCAPAPAPCAHDECLEGAKLDASCSSCAGAVCAADPFCCDTAWDYLCVDGADQICGC